MWTSFAKRSDAGSVDRPRAFLMAFMLLALLYDVDSVMGSALRPCACCFFWRAMEAAAATGAPRALVFTATARQKIYEATQRLRGNARSHARRMSRNKCEVRRTG